MLVSLIYDLGLGQVSRDPDQYSSTHPFNFYHISMCVHMKLLCHTLSVHGGNLRARACCALPVFFRGTCTSLCISSWCSWTGSALVKKSAKLLAPFCHFTFSRPCRILSRTQWNLMSMLFDLLILSVSLASPTVQPLSVHRYAFGCMWPIAPKTTRTRPQRRTLP